MVVLIPGCAQVTCSGTVNPSETWANVFHVAFGEGILAQNEADYLASTFENYYNSVRARRIASAWNLTQISVRRLDQEGAPTYLYNPTGITGQASGSPLPLQVAQVITLRSATNSRRGRGRSYQGGFTSTSLATSGGRFSASHTNAEGAAFSDLGEALLLGAFPLVVASRTAQLMYQVERISIDDVPDTQRRRVRELPPITIYSDVLGVA